MNPAPSRSASIIASTMPARRSSAGAASDALLLEAMSTAGPIIVVQSPGVTLVSDTTIAGHLLVTTHSDHVVRTVPVAATGDRHAVPAFGIALYEAFQQQTSFVRALSFRRRRGLALGQLCRQWNNQRLPNGSYFIRLERHRASRHAIGSPSGSRTRSSYFFQTRSRGESWLLPTGQTVTSPVVHLHVLNMLMTDNRLYQLGATQPFFDDAARSLVGRLAPTSVPRHDQPVSCGDGDCHVWNSDSPRARGSRPGSSPRHASDGCPVGALSARPFGATSPLISD